MVKGVKSLQEWAAVQELYKQKVPILQIATQLKMSRNTVKRLIKLKEEPKYSREDYPSLMDPYMEKIILWRTDRNYDFNGTRIYRELKKLGYTGSISPIYRVLKQLKTHKHHISPKATTRIETPVGDQAQFDWSPYDLQIGNLIKTVYCYTMILSASRKKAICFSYSSDGNSIYEAIQELFEDLGGVTLELVIDNPKALVIENNPHSDDGVKYNPKALLLAAHLGTELNACNYYRARTKGKIEKPYQYIEEQFIKGSSFTSMEDLTKCGKDFIDEWNHETHQTTRRIPSEFYESEEQQTLLPLPKTRFTMVPLKQRIISSDSFISIDTNKYSLPIKYATRTVKYRLVYGYRIDIYDTNEQLILSVEATQGKYSTLKNKEHYEPISRRVNKSIPQIKRQFCATFSQGTNYFNLATKLVQQPSYHARRILELTDLYSVEALDKIINYGVANSCVDIKSIKKLLKESYFDIVTNEDMAQALVATTQPGITRDCSYYEEESEMTTL